MIPHFALYAAEIDGGHKRIGAHYHTEGKEIYQIVEAKGKMHIGIPKSGNEVDWNEPALENTSSEKLNQLGHRDGTIE
ncbi:MAG: hypothetical protein PHE70_09370 [Tepidanaerobacteraceae bacterium]|jgi:hypothetical protein|nr:hypothetical protein [Tepidanaerobacteraceae bacterium]